MTCDKCSKEDKDHFFLFTIKQKGGMELYVVFCQDCALKPIKYIKNYVDSKKQK